MRHVRRSSRLIAAIALACAAATLTGPSRAHAADKPDPDPAAGRNAYVQHCSRCHGDLGKGDGRDAKRLYPRPRDLTSGVFKFRSTASNTAPTDDDLFRTLEHGLTAGGMPDWSQLDDATRWQLVYYVKSLSTVFTDSPPEPATLGPDPGPKHADLARGKAIYDKLGCASCHGASGRANSASAASFQDNWGHPIRPADLTQGWNYRAGGDVRSIAIRMMTGIDGTPMPTYAEALASPEEAWQMAYYVHSLQEEPRWVVMTHAMRVEGELPHAIDDPRWTRAERADVRLRNAVNAAGEMTGPQTVTALSLRAVYNDAAVAMLVSWHDPSDDHEEHADALAIALRPADVAGDTLTLQTWPLRDAPALDLCVWSAGRPATGPVGQTHEVLTNQFDTALDRRPHGIPLPSEAVYADGRWTLLVTRPLAPQGLANRAARFSTGVFTPIGFVVWDGGNAEQRAISPWIDLMLGPTPSHEAVREAPTKPEKPAASASSSSSRRRAGPVVLTLAGVVLVAALALAVKRS